MARLSGGRRGRTLEPRDAAALAIVAGALAAATVLVAALDRVVGVPDPSPAYLVAVVVAAVAAGTPAAVVTAVGAVVLYDFLFTQPVHTLVVTDAGEWLRLGLLLFVGVVVGRLAASQRERAEAAARREREAIASFRVSHTLAGAASAQAALQDLLGLIATETRFARAWVMLGAPGGERVAADSGTGPQPASSMTLVLKRRPGDEPAEWSLVHSASRVGGPPLAGLRLHRVAIELAGRPLGSLWLSRPSAAGRPTREETRLVSAAADQLARALDRDALADAALAAEVARRSDRLKTALLESVSHDLRTPLASIRTAAGNLTDPEVALTPAEVRATAESIDRDAERLSALVANLLDLGRIEGGALHPERQPFVLADLVADAVARLRSQLPADRLEVSIGHDLPPVFADPLYVDQALANVLENAVRHTPDQARIRISACGTPGAGVTLTVEDAGPGVPDEFLGRIFERFFRVVHGREGARRGSGIGLTVVRGLIEATGGAVRARRSPLGGLAVDLELPVLDAEARPLEEDDAPSGSSAR